MSIISEIPEALQSDKDVVPFIVRANEMANHNPVISYYCKVYVLEHILNKKLHTEDKETELFTVQLLDNTEQVKSDEEISQVLDNKTTSLSLVYAFTLRLFNQCLNGLNNYKLGDKPKLASTIKATLNFLSLVKLFDNDTIDFAKISGGKQTDFGSFEAANKEKIKLLKYQLSKLMKDEIPSKEDDELEEELEKELDKLEQSEEQPELQLPDTPKNLESTSPDVASAPKADEDLEIPSPPKFIDEGTETDEPSLPTAPHISPEDNSGLNLPGAPQLFPGDDISHINKTSSIHMIPKTNAETEKPAPKPKAEPKRPVPHKPLTQENITSIIDKEESISKIQKHAKFAISALNYEDLNTAEKELLQGLELIKLVRESESKRL